MTGRLYCDCVCLADFIQIPRPCIQPPTHSLPDIQGDQHKTTPCTGWSGTVILLSWAHKIIPYKFLYKCRYSALLRILEILNVYTKKTSTGWKIPYNCYVKESGIFLVLRTRMPGYFPCYTKKVECFSCCRLECRGIFPVTPRKWNVFPVAD